MASAFGDWEKARRMTGYTEELETERAMKDQFMARHPESPFVQGSVYDFHGLQYYPIDERFRLRARLERLDEPKEAFLRTNRDGQAAMRWIGDVRFSLSGRALKLRVYHAGEGVGTSVFVPFRDGTSGRETYGPGRYLTLELNESDDYELDFNRAFNPYCAYTDAFECGFPPAENDLPVPVKAGERVWSAERNPRTPSSAVIALLPPRPEPKSSSQSKRAPPAPAKTRRRPVAKKPSRSKAAPGRPKPRR
ncbi:MAG TPA: DUF1684 domain-containing protein [Thermoplasmata archaeon]|nr:DUF1684 domain-containing protein [Thermoplasmata archaeon]